jgi:acyl-CoA reductase-like NAD-dependent aldehyde dehydrogenase
MVKALSKIVQVGLPVNSFNAAAKVVETFSFEEKVGNSLVVREPIGVVGCITPWNYPLHQIAAKVAYALASGCTVVLKPSEIAPVDAFILAEVIHEIGLPAGVFNLVSGDGPTVGEAIASHPGVDMVSFTGSTRAGRRVAQLAAETMKKVALELGGKSANVLLDDLDEAGFAKAVADGVGKCFLNSGQTCSALTRMLVPRARLAEAETVAAATAAAFTVGDPFDETSKLGPLASDAQRQRVRGYVTKGIEEGAKLVTGGAEAPAGLDKGFYVQPTVFSDVRPDMTIAQEEIFGPVLSILPYDTEDDAVRIANDTVYGLAGGVWSADKDRATRVARRLRTGQVEVNGGRFNPNAPFGGYKQSGVGREYGHHGLEEFLEVKSLQL